MWCKCFKCWLVCFVENETENHCNASSSPALLFHKVESAQNRFSLPCLSPLAFLSTDSVFPWDAWQPNMFRHTHALPHHGQRVTLLLHERCLFSQGCAASSTSSSFNKRGWVYMQSPPVHTHRICIHAAAFPAPRPRLPSIVPPHCGVERQLAAERPGAMLTRARFPASLSGCSIWARKHAAL